MSAGLPGAGIGAVFYLLLVAWMPLGELAATAMGASSDPPRWPFIGRMVFFSLAMLVVSLVDGLLIKGVLTLAAVYMPGLWRFALVPVMVPSSSFVFWIALIPFSVLLLLMACLYVIRLSLPARPSIHSELKLGFSSQRLEPVAADTE
jgi:hypothetical protein